MVKPAVSGKIVGVKPLLAAIRAAGASTLAGVPFTLNWNAMSEAPRGVMTL